MDKFRLLVTKKYIKVVFILIFLLLSYQLVISRFDVSILLSDVTKETAITTLPSRW